MQIKEHFIVFVKSLAMGAANVIPGVSGGTIALITGIFERLITAIKSFDLVAVRLLFAGNFRNFAKYIDLQFITSIILGIGVAIISLARLFDFLFREYPVYIWAFFFGLVLASVYFVGKTIKRWHSGVIISFITGTAIAIFISVATPGMENDKFWYLLICGAIAMCSMILPGLSGSFVLILMGNYQLMIDAINNMRLDVILPFVIGAIVGIIAFSHFLSWLLKRFRDSTIATLTGFTLGSLGFLWPWKIPIIEIYGDIEKVAGYKWLLPQINIEFSIALICCILGIFTIYFLELAGGRIKKSV